MLGFDPLGAAVIGEGDGATAHALTITSRRADHGLPDVANDFAYDDEIPGYGTYFDDGFSWTDAAGSVLAGQQPLEEGKRSPRLRVPARLSGRALKWAFAER